MNKDSKIFSVDDYINGFQESIQIRLNRIREIIKEVAPNAEETISYGLPTYKQNGILVHFGAFKKHIGFYPTPSAIEYFQKELSQYDVSKGSIKFPFEKEIPYSLIGKIVEFKIKENLEI